MSSVICWIGRRRSQMTGCWAKSSSGRRRRRKDFRRFRLSAPSGLRRRCRRVYLHGFFFYENRPEDLDRTGHLAIFLFRPSSFLKFALRANLGFIFCFVKITTYPWRLLKHWRPRMKLEGEIKNVLRTITTLLINYNRFGTGRWRNLAHMMQVDFLFYCVRRSAL